jgi:hypothetical protein
MGGVDNIPERLSRYVHLFGGLVLIHALQVGQPDGLEFIQPQNYFFQLTQRYRSGFEV